jgi:hypothetical protein
MPVEGTAATVGFALVLPAGTATLWVPPAQAAVEHGARGDVAAALALEPALAALQVLQQWLGQPVRRIEPVDPQATPDAEGSLTLSLAGCSGAVVALPAALLPSLPFGRSAAGVLGNWPLLRARLLVQAFEATAVAENTLREGALLLLPASFEPAGFAVRLQVPGWPLLALPHWVPGSGVLDLAGACVDSLPATQVGGWSVALEAPLLVPASAWFDGGGVARPIDTPAVLRLASRRVAQGELVPVARGWALRLAQVLQEAAA